MRDLNRECAPVDMSFGKWGVRIYGSDGFPLSNLASHEKKYLIRPCEAYVRTHENVYRIDALGRLADGNKIQEIGGWAYGRLQPNDIQTTLHLMRPFPFGIGGDHSPVTEIVIATGNTASREHIQRICGGNFSSILQDFRGSVRFIPPGRVRY